MKNLKRLAMSLTLVATFAITVAAGETNSPPCEPGQTETPPCALSSGNSMDPGETQSPPASEAVDLISLAEDVAWSLLLF